MRPSNLIDTLSVMFPAHEPVLLKGAPGVGKTAIVKRACSICGAKLIISHPVVNEPIDYKGMPFVQNGHADFLPFGDLRALIEARELTVFFLDDLGQAPAAVQAAAMQLILERKINGHEVSPCVTFIAATNRKQDRAGVMGVIEPVKSRFITILELTPELEDWVPWALEEKMPVELIAFMRFRPNLLFDFKPTADITNSPCPRTVANVGRLMKMGLPANTEYEIYSGAAGDGFAAELMGFLKIYRNLTHPDVILMNPDTAPVAEDPATLYATCGALARRVSDQTADRICRYACRMPAEFSVLLMRDCMQIYPQIVNHREYIAWAAKNNNVLN
ncbi:MAG: ATP-binding protein [bacterium]